MLKAIGVTFASSLLTIVCHFLTLLILIRVLDEHMMGVYFIVLLIAHLLVMLSDFGIELALVKRFPEEDRSGQASLLRLALLLRFASCFAISMIFVALLAGGTVAILRDVAPIALLTLVFFWLHSFRALQLRVLQAEKLFGAFAGVQALAAALKVVFVLMLLPFEGIGVGHVVAAETMSLLVSVVYGLYAMKQHLAAALRASTASARELLAFGFPLHLNALVGLGNTRVTYYIVATMGGPVAIAFFSVADRLSDAGRRLFVAFVNVYLPMQTNLVAASEIDEAKKLASRSMLWIAFIMSGVTLAFAIVREPVFVLLFTSKYVATADTAVMFFGVLLLYALQVLMGYFAVANGHNYFPVKTSLISSVFNIAASLWLFSLYGNEGAATALILTQALIATLYYIWLQRVGLKLDVVPVAAVLVFLALALGWVYFFAESLLIGGLALPAFAAAALVFVAPLRADIAELRDRYVPVRP